jgi:hypothetical protein
MVYRVAGAFLAMTVAFLVACDPGMSISQEDMSKTSGSKGDLIIRIAPRHQLIGESRYSPKVEVTNTFDTPLKITSVELATLREIYANHPVAKGIYPVTLSARATAGLEVRFDLAEPVHKAFKQPAELRIHYLTVGGEKVATVRLVGGPLD